jgi:hypothetical protein
MSDREMAEWLRPLRRLSQEEVDRRERVRDIARGYYQNRELVTHHSAEESRH